MKKQEPFLTSIFREVSNLDIKARRDFLIRVGSNPFYAPEANDRQFADLVRFTSETSEMREEDFAQNLPAPVGLLKHWMKAEHLPPSSRRHSYVSRMTNLALEQREFGQQVRVPAVA